MRWTEKECKQLASLAKRNVPLEAISLRLGRSEASISSKARQVGIRLNRSIALPKLGLDGRLTELGGVNIPSRPRWVGARASKRRSNS